MVAKKDGRIRVCIDCTPANKVTQSVEWPLPRLQDLRHKVKGNRYFARIDLKDAFFRISVPPQHRHLTAFKVEEQAYQFRQMPFGLKTAPAVFQRFMDWGLSSHHPYAYWYMDDILVMAETRKELAKKENLVRQELKRMKCEINEEKSETQRTKILFAGIQITSEGTGYEDRHVREILRTPAPTTKTEAQSALGLVSYLRDFIPLVGHFTAQLYPDKNGLRLEPQQYQEQWAKLLRHLANACTINHHWKDGQAADLYTDASQHALGVILIQNERVVALSSRKLSPAETRYSATDREHLGLVHAAEKFKIILHQSSSPVRVSSDHMALLTRHKSKLTPRQSRWNEHITTWIPQLTHVKGKENPADYISRWRIGAVGAKIQA